MEEPMTPMTFDLDCGDLLGGRRLVATGIRVDGTSDDDVHADYSGHVEGKPVCPTRRARPEAMVRPNRLNR
jgi:vacuolar-type H+-ATPase subunit B/Vma2